MRPSTDRPLQTNIIHLQRQFIYFKHFSCVNLSVYAGLVCLCAGAMNDAAALWFGMVKFLVESNVDATEIAHCARYVNLLSESSYFAIVG